MTIHAMTLFEQAKEECKPRICAEIDSLFARFLDSVQSGSRSNSTINRIHSENSKNKSIHIELENSSNTANIDDKQSHIVKIKDDFNLQLCLNIDTLFKFLSNIYELPTSKLPAPICSNNVPQIKTGIVEQEIVLSSNIIDICDNQESSNKIAQAEPVPNTFNEHYEANDKNSAQNTSDFQSEPGLQNENATNSGKQSSQTQLPMTLPDMPQQIFPPSTELNTLIEEVINEEPDPNSSQNFSDLATEMGTQNENNQNFDDQSILVDPHQYSPQNSTEQNILNNEVNDNAFVSNTSNHDSDIETETVTQEVAQINSNNQSSQGPIAGPSTESFQHNIPNDDSDSESDCDCDECVSKELQNFMFEKQMLEVFENVYSNEVRSEVTDVRNEPTTERHFLDSDQTQKKPETGDADLEEGELAESEDESAVPKKPIFEKRRQTYKTLSIHCDRKNCIKSFRCLETFNDHLWQVHQIFPFCCRVENCDASFRDGNQLYIHIQSDHRDVDRWSCPKCKLYYYDRYEHLHSHFFLNHMVGKFQCKQCHLISTRRIDMIQHEELVHQALTSDADNEAGQNCARKEQFKLKFNEANLKFTIAAHHQAPKRPYDKKIIELAIDCDRTGCTMSFPTVALFFDHLWDEHQFLPQRCLVENCDASFPNKRLLHDHVGEMHRNIFKWNCSKCVAKFKSYDALTSHHFMLHEEGKYQCIDCEFVTDRRFKVLKHHDHVHMQRWASNNQANHNASAQSTVDLRHSLQGGLKRSEHNSEQIVNLSNFCKRKTNDLRIFLGQKNKNLNAPETCNLEASSIKRIKTIHSVPCPTQKGGSHQKKTSRISSGNNIIINTRP